MQRLYPEDPGYLAAIARLLAKARAIDPGFRLATPSERQYCDASELYSFTGSDGRMVAPVFIRDKRAVLTQDAAEQGSPDTILSTRSIPTKDDLDRLPLTTLRKVVAQCAGMRPSQGDT